MGRGLEASSVPRDKTNQINKKVDTISVGSRIPNQYEEAFLPL
jgi:hypothetical protein